MKKNDLDKLIEKYYEGETTEVEDQLLERMMMDKNIAPEYAMERDVLTFFAEQRKAELSPEFDSRFMSAITRQSSTIKILIWGASMAAVITMLAAVIYLFSMRDAGAIIKITTGLYEKKDIKLPDGSVVSLNYNSEIRYPENFKVREISLTGEAYFDVAPDKSHPFKIKTSGSVTEVVGTSFNLRSDNTDSVVNLIVVTGSVVFSTYKDQLQERIFLSEGNEIIFNKNKNSVKKYERSDPNSLAWKTGQLTFNDAPMNEVISVLRRYFNKPIVTENGELLNCHFKAGFNHPQLSDVLNVFDFTMNIKSEMKGDTLKLYGKGCNP